MADRIFGVSTRLFGDARLTRDHLVDIAAHKFDAIELVALDTHFDYRDTAAIAQLAEWLTDTRLMLHSVHAAAGQTVEEIDAVLAMARELPYRFLVMHRPAAATEKTLHAITESATAVGVTVALEVRQEKDSTAQALVTLLEDELDGMRLGICLDFAHATLGGDLDEAIELVSGHLVTTHVHDVSTTRAKHLVPYSGTIAWETAMMEMQKVGYDGALMFELGPSPDPVAVLAKAAKARERLEKTFVTF